METKIAAVIGQPVSHSRSPEIFTFLAKRAKLPLVYKRIEVAPNELDVFFSAVAGKGIFCGFNVTLPHKERVLSLVSQISPEAKAVGAVNVVRFSPKGSEGFNTDVFGIRFTLVESGRSFKNKVAVVFGAGGAAKAVLYALGREKLKSVYIVNRTPEKARQLALQFSALFPKTNFQTAADTSQISEVVALIINSTAIGLKGNPGRIRLPRQFEKKAFAFDLIYQPSTTPFLLQANKKGLQTVNGLDMLIWQALATWKIWFGPIDKLKLVKQQLKQSLLKK